MAGSNEIPTADGPVTREGLVADLKRLGIAPGGVLLVHMSLSRVGWVVGGARSVIEALLETLGNDGTLVMPAFSDDLYDPSVWHNSSLPESWYDTIRAQMPAFDPARTPSRGMGQVAELFRCWPGVRRSDHPTDSLAACGRFAADITASQPLSFGLGDAGPMGRIYDLEGSVLLIGVGHEINSSLHLAEARAPNGRRTKRKVLVMRDGERMWQMNPDVADDRGTLFPRIGHDFEDTGAVRFGKVGHTEGRLMPQRALVDFATTWLQEELAKP